MTPAPLPKVPWPKLPKLIADLKREAEWQEELARESTIRAERAREAVRLLEQR